MRPGYYSQLFLVQKCVGGIASCDQLVKSEWLCQDRDILFGTEVDQEGDFMFLIDLSPLFEDCALREGLPIQGYMLWFALVSELIIREGFDFFII